MLSAQACLFSRLFQTGKVQTKVGTIEQNVRWQESSSKHLFLELLEYTVCLKKGKYHPSIFEKYRIFNILLHRQTHLNAHNKTAKYFLKIKGQKHNIFSLELDKTKRENQS